jgi:hypothetical protein
MNPPEDSMRAIRSVIAAAVCVPLVSSCGCAEHRLHTMAVPCRGFGALLLLLSLTENSTTEGTVHTEGTEKKL